ncbi:MAG TPA: 4'-phosphopantetheinyl transferase superfamily protein [Burkholderiaceae bacterium]|nr:4'-phosphopantetheinyl transferase superfamily protein [Burkholderiaceae bacterium]
MIKPGYSMTTKERQSLGVADEWRRTEFAAGRHHLRKALAALGRPAPDLVSGGDGAPVLPADVVASITHVRGTFGTFVAAAAALLVDAGGVGIDVEEAAGVEPELWLRFLQPDEWREAVRLPVTERREHVARVWCAKEAAFKALRPRCELRDIHVVLGDLATGAFTGECLGAHVEGRAATAGPLALAACVALRPRPALGTAFR